MLFASPSNPNMNQAILRVVGVLEELGLQGQDLTRAYQQWESFVLGSTLFDLAGAPNHLESRLDRLRQLRNDSFDQITRHHRHIDDNNEAAFAATLRTLVDSLSTDVAAAAAVANPG